jgi:polar amino acid transport system substrate-binding protein
MKKSISLILTLFALAATARAQTLVFAVSTGSAMPMTEFRNEQLSGGLLKDFGDALARELGMTPRYLLLPRKRVESALQAGTADLLCDLRPEWLDRKDWAWTGTVFSNNMIVAGRSDTVPLPRIAALAGQRVGTILGYRYPELESQLGKQLLRDDAASDDLTTAKLLNRRFDYAVSNSLYYDYQRKVHPAGSQLHKAVLIITAFDTYCALAPRAKVDVAKVNRAIVALRRRGDMQHIYERYRPAN